MIQFHKINFNTIFSYRGLRNGHFPSRSPIKILFKINFTPMNATLYTFCDFSFIPQDLTSSKNYENPQNASFSAQFLCLQFKHSSHHSALKHNQLINGKKHSQVLKAFFHVFHSIHVFTIHILKNKIDQLISNQSDPQTTFHTTYQLQKVSAPRCQIHRVF